MLASTSSALDSLSKIWSPRKEEEGYFSPGLAAIPELSSIMNRRQGGKH